MNANLASKAIPLSLAVIGAAVLALWLAVEPQQANVTLRLPGQDQRDPATQPAIIVNIEGTFAPGQGTPSDLPGSWPCFRGPRFDAISTEQVPLSREWQTAGPPKLWSLPVGEGYAGAAIARGRVYLLDYDEVNRGDALRCLSLADGKEIWRRFYAIDIGRDHGISRTVPSVTDKYVLTIGPKCQVLCADATSGQYKWGIDLVREYNFLVPQWYNGQCPLIDGDRVILAPGGDSLLIAVDLETGNVLWKTPNPRKWLMTHSSVIPMTFNGAKMYLYCASGGAVGVSATDGAILWEMPEWKVKMANVPSPLPVGEDRIFLTGGYGAGSMMLRLVPSASGIKPTILYRLTPAVFGAEQHTPIYYKGFIYGLLAPKGQLVCLDPDGRVRWKTGAKDRFGAGPFMIADGLLIVLNENGTLALVEATETGYKPVASAKVIEKADQAWGPLALAGGRLIARDMTQMVCLDLRKVPND